MKVRAEHDHRFNRRNIWLTIAGIGLLIWGIYDAFYAYPKKLKISQAYEAIHEEHKGDLEAAAVAWNEKADANGWDRVEPKEARHVAGDIVFSKWVAGAGILMALFFLIKFLRTRSSWIEADEQGLSSSWGKSFAFKDIESIDKIKWEKKGIAKITYSENGDSKIFTLDDFKYLREPMGAIMELAEANLKPDQIVTKREDGLNDADHDE